MNNQALLDFYNSGIEEERLTRRLTNRIEFETTLWVLESYIPAHCKLLEIGSATGRYAIHYALQGHQVTAVDVVPSQVAHLRAQIAKKQVDGLKACIGDARNLDMVADNSMDVVLCLGPLYHLQTEQDRLLCLSEALRVLKPNGILAIAYLNRFLTAALRVKREPEIIHTGFLDAIAKKGIIDDPAFDGFTRSAYFATPDEMEALLTRYQVSILEHVAVDGPCKLLEDVINSMTEEEFQIWLRYHWATCREKSILGYSNHGLIICQKSG